MVFYVYRTVEEEERNQEEDFKKLNICKEEQKRCLKRRNLLKKSINTPATAGRKTGEENFALLWTEEHERVGNLTVTLKFRILAPVTETKRAEYNFVYLMNDLPLVFL